LSVTNMATASGGLSCDVKSVSSSHSNTPSPSEGSGAANGTGLVCFSVFRIHSGKPPTFEPTHHSRHVYRRDNVSVPDCSCQRHCGLLCLLIRLLDAHQSLFVWLFFCVFCFLWFLFRLLFCWFVLALGNWIALWTM